MALFTHTPRKDELVPKPESKVDSPQMVMAPPLPGPVRREEEAPKPAATARSGESVLAAGLTIEGKIEGSGSVRIAGRFKGNINIQGEFLIDPGASIEGEVRAETVLVGGQVRGQIVASSRVELRESGSLIGDIKAGSLTVVAGSKMRGKVEFGWKEGELEDAAPIAGGQSPRL